MLNPMKNEICAVRGNCDTEVDQMVLDFPIMADYGLFVIDGRTLYATHGHVYNQDNLPPMKAGDILVHGHTHLLKAETVSYTHLDVYKRQPMKCVMMLFRFIKNRPEQDESGC